MTFEIERFLISAVKGKKPLMRARSGFTGIPTVRLGGNENIYGCSPLVSQAFANYSYLHNYPDEVELKKLLAGYAGVTPENIVPSNGGSEFIDLLIRLLVERGDEVLSPTPTFDPFRHRTQLCGGNFIGVPREDDFSVNVSKIKSAITNKTKLIIIANPNNPTGTLTSPRDIIDIVDLGLPVLVDEAYAEYSGQTIIPMVNNHDNLIVLRTFSKWAGLAGLRVGYGIASPKIAEYLRVIRLTFPVNTLAVIAVRESLKDIDYLQQNVQAIIAERERLYSELVKIDFLKTYPSRANFICCAVLRGEANNYC